MSQPTNNKKLSDIARENNVAKANRFSASMIPAPPPVKSPVEEEPEEKNSEEFDDAVAEAIGLSEPASQPVMPETNPVSKPTRAKRNNGALNVEDLVQPQPPKDESYPKQVRISAKHHRLLREVSFKKDVTINHVLFNLLEQLYEANQRDNQQHV